MHILKCPVCQLELILKDQTYQCNNNHSYDIAKKGYTNLLLANQGHHLHSGDDEKMVAARVRFLASNHYQILQQAILDCMKEYLPQKEVTITDVACGEGYYTEYFHEQLSKEKDVSTFGVDISKYAIMEAAKKKRQRQLQQLEYFVGNLDYLPFLTESFDLLVNCFAPMNENEFSRVLKKDGIFIRILPGAEHLLGLKRNLYQDVYFNEKKDNRLHHFEVLQELEIHDIITLTSNQEIMDLFTMTPYFYKTSKEAILHLTKLSTLETKISFLIVIYKKKS